MIGFGTCSHNPKFPLWSQLLYALFCLTDFIKRNRSEAKGSWKGTNLISEQWPLDIMDTEYRITSRPLQFFPHWGGLWVAGAKVSAELVVGVWDMAYLTHAPHAHTVNSTRCYCTNVWTWRRKCRNLLCDRTSTFCSHLIWRVLLLTVSEFINVRGRPIYTHDCVCVWNGFTVDW